jgi:hypothetical protein
VEVEMRLRIGGLALAVGLVAGAFLALPAAQAGASCGRAHKAKNIKHYGVTCSQAKKVVAEDVSRHKCRSSCSFKKVGYEWSCQSRPSGLNACNAHVGTKRYTVTFEYTGGKHSRTG